MPKKPDEKKLKKIRSVLTRYPKGLWIRELARRTKIPISSLHYYLYNQLKQEVSIENMSFAGIKSQHKLVRLKRK